MNPHFGPAPHAPQPAPDGLASAFRAADRRRLRTMAFAAVAPVLVAFLVAGPFGQDDERGLQPTMPPGVTATGTPSVSPSVTPTAEPEKSQGGPEGPARTAEAAPAASEPPPSALTRPGAPPQTGDVLVFTGDGASFAEFEITSPYTLDLSEITHGGDESSPYGFYIESADRRTVQVGKVHLPHRSLDTSWVSFQPSAGMPVEIAELDPGAYTVWVVGTGPTWVAVPFTGRGSGFAVHARRRAETAYTVSTGWGSGSAEHEQRVRIPARDTAVAGLVIADAYGAGPVARLTACHTSPGDSCTAGSPYAAVQEPFFAYEPFWLADEEELDAVALWQGGDVVSTVHLTVTYFVIYLGI